MVPETAFARGRDGWVAYQVVGDGPIDILVSKPWFFPIDLMWEEPSFVHLLEGFSSFSRSIWMDPRGTGASDAVEHVDGRLVESIVDDMITVLDDIDCGQVSVFGCTAPPGLLFAAAHPERTKALVLVNPVARIRTADDYEAGLADEQVDEFLDTLRVSWGSGRFAGGFVSSRVGDERFSRWCARCERLAMEPAEAYWRMRAVFDADVRHVLSAIRVPTAVISGGDPTRRAQSRYVVDHVAGARITEVDADDILILGMDSGAVLDAVEEFLTGGLPSHSVDRMLATVMFTDVVRSTEALAQAGDRRWRELLATHDTFIRAELARFEGREVKATGDGILATFDGPGAVCLRHPRSTPIAPHRRTNRAPHG